MQGKMKLLIKQIHESKPKEVELPNGEVVKTIVCFDDPKGERTWTRCIQL